MCLIISWISDIPSLLAFLATLLRQDSVQTEFDEALWFAVIDKVIVHVADDIRFTFRDDTVIKALCIGRTNRRASNDIGPVVYCFRQQYTLVLPKVY